MPSSIRSSGSPSINLCDWGGTGEPLLLIHGMGGNTHWWDQVAPLLLAGHHPVAADLLGHGDSDPAREALYTTDGYVAGIESARSTLGWERMVLVCHSLGARLGLEYARRHPSRLKALVVVDFLTEFLRGRSRRFERGLALPQPIYKDPELMAQRFHLEPPGTLLDQSSLRSLARHCIRTIPQGFTWKFDWKALRYRYEPIWPVLPYITVPTLLVRGEQSTVMNRADFERVLNEQPRFSGLEIARSHHHVPLDAPRELADAIVGFVAGALKREQLAQGKFHRE